MKRLNHSFVGRSQDTLNCLLGVHDGPKVVMPGDRLANGVGVSPRQRGRSTISGQLAGTDGRSKERSWQPFVGHLDTTATAGSEYMVRAHATVREVAGPSPAQDNHVLGSSVNPLAITFVATKQ